MKDFFIAAFCLLICDTAFTQITIQDVPLDANEELVETEDGIMYYNYYQDKTLKVSQKVILHLRKDTTYHINPFTMLEDYMVTTYFFVPYGLSAEYDEEGNLIENYNYDTGEFTTFFPDGAIKVSGTYLDEKKHERWRYFNDIYLLIKVEHYDNGLLSGAYNEFYENGQLMIKGNYMIVVSYDTTFNIDPISLEENRIIKEVPLSVKCGTWKYYDLGKEEPKRVVEERKCNK